MFTGIIEEVGTVASVREVGSGREIVVRAERVLEGTELGDSISIDGACQTVTALTESGFTVQSVGTTLERTTLGEFRLGQRVNLERALSFGARLGGHLVQGHVDGVGVVRSVERRAELVLIDFTLPPEVAEVTVLHGSVTLNGVSLTVNALPEAGVVQVSIIPFTWDHTALSDLRAGERVNVEGDLIGKYVRHLLGAPAKGRSEEQEGGVTADLLRSWGY
jgi:riboflavin synthase